MEAITKEEYKVLLRNFIREEMAKGSHEGEPASFWVKFNKDKKVQFDRQLASKGIIVAG